MKACSKKQAAFKIFRLTLKKSELQKVYITIS